MDTVIILVLSCHALVIAALLLARERRRATETHTKLIARLLRLKGQEDSD